MMINDADCDIEPLRETDFQSGQGMDDASATAGHCIEMAKLATLSTSKLPGTYREADPVKLAEQSDWTSTRMLRRTILM
jgi:hypothetical protein